MTGRDGTAETDARSPRGEDIYVAPREIADVDICSFYHAMTLPGYGEIAGSWDLRPGIENYLGGMSFAGKRVLDLGSADGYLTFHIEKQGAEVVSYDLTENDSWDTVPYARLAASRTRRPTPSVDAAQASARNGAGLMPSWAENVTADLHPMRKVNNAYWLAHRAFGSEARFVGGDVYSVPREIGPVDVSVFGALLLHTENPFRALQSALDITSDTAIVTDGLGLWRMPAPFRWVRSQLPPQLRRPVMRFMPQWETCASPDGWWRLTPEIVQGFLAVLGFEDSRVSTHFQLFNGRRRRLFTVVARRTVSSPVH